MTRRLLSAFVALFLLTGFVAACGDDDDDDVTVEDEATDEEATEDEATDEEDVSDDESAMDDVAEGSDAEEGASNPTDEFCVDWNESTGGDTPIEDVQASLDLVVAAQADAPSQEVADAMQVLIDLAQYVIDNDDGDGVVTDAEAQAAVEQFPTFEDAGAVVNEYCAG